jgi:SsrA-binding protein
MAEKKDNYKVIAQNKRARFDYEIMETLEVGIVLQGSEMKSIRQGKVSINESFAGDMQGEIFLFNEPRRPRKLLMHNKQLNKFLGAIRRKGLTLVPIVLYFNHRGRVKLLLGLGRGKKTVDKRETIKERDWDRSRARILRNRS